MPVVVSGVFTDSGPSYQGSVVSLSPSFPFLLPFSLLQFIKGRYWYTDTTGMLHNRTVAIASINYVIGDGVLLSMNSRVGVAISDSELLLVSELGFS